MLNKKRNEGPVRALRGEWSKFQHYDRQQRALQNDPGNEKLAKLVADLETKISGMEERIAEHEKAAKEIQEQIYASNTPPARTYTLKRID